MDVSKPTLPTTVTSVRPSNRSGSATQEDSQHIPTRVERQPERERRPSDDRRQADRRQGNDRRQDSSDVMLDTRSGEDRRKGPRRQTDDKPPENDGPSLGIDVFV